jgi:hypothetical protein
MLRCKVYTLLKSWQGSTTATGVCLHQRALAFLATLGVAYMDRLPDVRLMGFSWADGDHDLTMMKVVPDSVGDAS